MLLKVCILLNLYKYKIYVYTFQNYIKFSLIYKYVYEI